MVSISAPPRKKYIVDSLFHLGKAEVVVLDVKEELWEVEELGDQLAHVGDFGGDALPANAKGVEESVTEIELPPLQSPARLRVGLQPDKKVKHNPGRAIMRAKLIRWHGIKGIDSFGLGPIVLHQLFIPLSRR